MANRRTDKCLISSPYSPDKWVTPAQYIAEVICEKLAKKEKKDLPNQFWHIKEWNTYYKQQILVAYKLLKTYSWKAVSRALQDKGAWSVYSLRAPHLLKIIERKQAEVIKEEAALATCAVEVPLDESLPANRMFMVAKVDPRKPKNKLSALKDLDDEMEGL